MDVKTYDAKDCSIVFNSIYITGLGESMVTGEKDEDNFTTNVGAQGDVVVNTVNNSLGTVEVTVQATSPQVPMLKTAANNGTTAPLWVTNKKLSTTFGGTMARIIKCPSEEHASEVSDLTFTFKVFDYTSKTTTTTTTTTTT